MNEDPEERTETLEEWIANNRAVWVIFGDRPWFAGIWTVEMEYTPEVDQMLLEGLPDWTMTGPDHVEVHAIPKNDRPDKYQPGKYREHAFKEVMAVRPVEKPVEREQIGVVTMLRLDQDAKITHLRLSGHFLPD